MITVADLRKLARARLKDARSLLSAKRFDGAIYIGGYVVEIALKARICRTLRWTEFPETRKEFESLTTFRTHDPDVLLALSGREQRTKTSHLAEWSVLGTWEPEARYRKVGSATKDDAELLVSSAEILLKAL
jgi:HEPN domain-containing protein